MAYWSGEKLLDNLLNIIDSPESVNSGSSTMVDCSALTLSVGSEIYISPFKRSRRTPSIQKLSDGEAFSIPPGQFALLITGERVTIPSDAMAFISIKSGKKLRGLVNVSGFHVDPGYRGKLIFGVLNAGPSPVHLRRGEPCFLMWIADLDRVSTKVKSQTGFSEIPVDMVSNISGEFKTVSGISARVDSVQLELRVTQGTVLTLVALVIAVATHAFWPGSTSTPPSVPASHFQQLHK